MDDMTHTPDELAAAVVLAIQQERDHQGISSRELARRMGVNPQYVSSRIDGGNPRTGERIAVTFKDGALFASALGLSSLELATRAERLADGEEI